MTKRTLDLWPIGNCQTSALIDREGRMIWACLPRVDGDPIFSALLTDKDYDDPETRGFWSIDLEDAVSVTQDYVRNTPVLRTLKTDARATSWKSWISAPASSSRGAPTGPSPLHASSARWPDRRAFACACALHRRGIPNSPTSATAPIISGSRSPPCPCASPRMRR